MWIAWNRQCWPLEYPVGFAVCVTQEELCLWWHWALFSEHLVSWAEIQGCVSHSGVRNLLDTATGYRFISAFQIMSDAAWADAFLIHSHIPVFKEWL